MEECTQTFKQSSENTQNKLCVYTQCELFEWDDQKPMTSYWWISVTNPWTENRHTLCYTPPSLYLIILCLFSPLKNWPVEWNMYTNHWVEIYSNHIIFTTNASTLPQNGIKNISNIKVEKFILLEVRISSK